MMRLMTLLYDIFKVFGNDNRAWFDSVQTFDAALARIEQFAKYLPGTYIVKNRTTSEERSFKVGRATQGTTNP
jgi:hypothetical protein